MGHGSPLIEAIADDFQARHPQYHKSRRETATLVRVAIKQLKTDAWLIVMTNQDDAKAALGAYLKATLEAIAGGHPKSRIDDLLPWNFNASS